MNVMLFGASGMIGQAVLKECLERAEVTRVLAVGRTALEQQHPKLEQLVRRDLFDYADVEDRLTQVDAVFFCLGISSNGVSEADYRRVTYDLPLAVAKVLERTSPQATFCFISGQGTDATGKSSTMWARVKGEAENALRATRLKAVYCFRPGYIQPMDGIVSKTPSYRMMYRVTTPLYPLLKHLPAYVTSTRQLGRAMVNVALSGAPKPVLENADLNALAGH